ncbi:MAG TPA: terminase small subunit [Candidatus Xenobia bacterium]|jgi:phage terminase small subunit
MDSIEPDKQDEVDDSGGTPPGSGLNSRQRMFVGAYVANGGNAKQAAIKAGYSEHTADRIGSRLLKNVEVKAAIDAAQGRVLAAFEVSGERLIQEYVRVAFQDPRAYLSWGPGDEKDPALVRITPSKDLTPEQAAVVAGVEETVNERGIRTLRIKFHDKMRALEVLAKIKGLFKDGPTVSVNVSRDARVAELTDEELEALIGRLGGGGSRE